MNKILIFIVAFMFSLLVKSQNLTSSDSIIPKFCIEGYFFLQKPEAIPANSRLFILKDSVENKVLGIEYAEGKYLSEKAKNLAVPIEKIANAQYLLDQYNSSQSFPSLITDGGAEENIVNVNDKFPKFTAKDINGKKWSNKDCKDKVMVLNLWYSGCGPCRKEMPELSTWKDQYPDIVFLSSTFENADIAKSIVEKHQFNWTHLVDDKQFLKWLGGKGYPMTIVVDKKGVIRLIENGTSIIQRDNILEAIKECANE